MPEETQIAESSPAEPIEVEELNDEQRDTWLKTNELPAKTPPKAQESVPAKKEEDKSAAKAESASASEPDESSDDKYGAGAQKRIKQLLARAKKAEEALAAAATRSAEPEKKAPEKSAEPAPAIAAPERPKRAAFDSDEKYEDALFEWRDKMRAHESAKAQADKLKSDIDAANKQIEETWKGRVAEAQKEHDDFDKIAFAKDLPIPYGSPVDEWILQSEVGAEMLYHFGKNREELKRINGLSRPAQHRELAKLEDKLSKSEQEPPKPKKLVSDALPPPKEVGGKGAAVEDEEEQLAKRASAGDDDAASRYIEAANRKELAKRRR